MTEASSSRENFALWFAKPLTTLMADDHSGFAVAMVTFPILERYLRAASGAEPNSPPFNQALLRVLPELQGATNANLFWAIFRHGILHNAALSRETHGLSPIKPIVEIGLNGKVWMNPNLFAHRVLATIRSDFAQFEMGIPLPQAQQVFEGTPGTPSYTAYWGTGMPPGVRK